MVTKLREIADQLGLSVATVSRVANNKPNIKDSTRQRVLEALSENNYVPDSTARSLKTGRTQTIGVIIPLITNVRFSYILDGVKDELSKHGYKMLLCVSDADANSEDEYMNYLSHNHCDGIILATVAQDDCAFRQVLGRGKSIVCINNLPNTSATYDAVITDNIKASDMAIDYLYGLGHRRVAMIASRQTLTAGRDRLLGYRRALERLGVPADENLIKIGNFEESSGYEAMRGLLGDAAGFSAVYVSNASMTIGAVKAIFDSGKKIPGDISVVGFDIHDPTGLMQPKITYISQQNEGIGKYACRKLLENIHDPASHAPQTILLQPDLVIRDSCRSLT